ESDLPRLTEVQAANPDKPIHEIIIEKGFVKEDHVLEALAEEFGLDVVDLTQTKVADETLQSMPLKLVHRHNLMPISRNNATLIAATGNPYNISARDELQALTGLNVLPVLASPREISRLIRVHFGGGGDPVADLAAERKEEVELL